MEYKKHIWIIGGLQSHQHWRNDGISPCLTTAMGQGGGQIPLVLVIPKSTSSQPKSTQNITQNTKTMATLPKSTQQNSQTSTSSLEDSLVKRLVLLESVGDLTTPEELSFLTSLGFSKKSDQEISYWKMSKDCYLTTLEELSKPSSPRLQNWGIAWNGKCLTQRISESHRIGKECSLSDILEESPNEKYFLSPKVQEKILKYIPEELRRDIESMM